MNRNQAIAMIVAAANVALIALFPPFDTYSLGKNQLPVFGGFYFYFGRNNSMIVNSSLLVLELFVILVNAAIAVLLLRSNKLLVKRRSLSLQNATLVFVAINLVVILVFPPFESVFALSNAAIPSFEGFYFIFARQQNHVIVTAVLYIEVIFVLIKGVIFWLILCVKDESVQSLEEAAKLMMAVRRRGG